MAPGDISFASCDASPVFGGCANFKGQSSIIEEAGGTSESSPFVAGAAALVIQAYRQTHSGATPPPALVKQILVSTATDLGAPAAEQGAGLLDSYNAVRLAESIHTPDGAPHRVGDTGLKSTNQLNAIAAPGTHESWNVTISNTGAHVRHLTLSGRTFGPNQNVQTGSVTLNDATSPQVTNYSGVPNNYSVIHFTVPSGVDRLDASIAYPGNPAHGNNSRVRLILVDPNGRFAAHTLPQGVGNYGNVDVRYPAAGTWTGVIFGVVAADGGTNGTVPWRVATQQFAPFGSVSPSTLTLHPGQKRTVTVSETTPSSPGDAAGSIVIKPASANISTTSIPVTLRSLVNVAGGGAFNGVLTGGNGRSPGEGQADYYEFKVGSGVSDVTANLSLTNDAGDPVGAYLVSPDGDTLGYGQNSINGNQTTSLTANTVNPVSGNWTLVVDFAEPIVGDEVSQAFTGNIKFNNAEVSAPSLPDNTSQTLAAGTPVTVPVSVTNNGSQAEDFFVDARLDTYENVSLAPFDQTTGLSLPLTVGSPVWFVPSETSRLSVQASAPLPIMFDFGTVPGDPDLASSSSAACSTTPSASYSPPGGSVTPGFWFATPDECGPYPAGAPAGTVSMAMSAQIKTFDPAITSSTGDIEIAALNPATTFSPVVINPGQTATINVTVTSSGPSGTVVTGNLYVDDFMTNVPPYGQEAGNEIAALPYAYTIL